MAGCSESPLVKKLGIKQGHRIYLENTPDHYDDLIEDWPEKIIFLTKENAKDADFIHFFTWEMAELEVRFPLLKKDGVFWVSWPKGSSALPKDLHGNDVRGIGLESGLVDVKVCAVDEN